MKTLLIWLRKLFSGQLCRYNSKRAKQNQRDKVIEMTNVIDMDEY